MSATLKRFLRRVSGSSGEFGTSAFSLAMLVFLVEEARANASLQDAELARRSVDASDLDAVRQVYGESASDSVAGIDYSAIADAVAQISELYAQESAVVEGAAAESDAAAQVYDAELDLVSRYVQDAVQYAQLATEGVAAEGAGTAATAEAAAAGAAAGLSSALPLILAGFGLIAATQTTPGVVTKAPGSVSNAGAAFDDYIVGADVWQDLDGDGVMDDNEPHTTTDEFGKYTLNLVEGSKAFVIVKGGHIGSADGPAFEGTLKAPPGSTVVSPLTTVVSAMMAQGKTLAEAKAAMLEILGVTDPNFDLMSFDPFDPDNADNEFTSLIQIEGQKIGALLSTAGDSSDDLAAQIAKGVLSGSLTLDDISDASKLQQLFEDAGVSTDGIDFDAIADELRAQSKSLSLLSTTIHTAGGVSGLNLAAFAAKGIEVIDVDGAYLNSSLSINSADAAAMNAAGLSFATGDTITLDLGTTDDLGVMGSYLSGSLNSSIGGISQGLSLSALGALGVDVIDINGSANNAALHISSADASAVSAAGLSFAGGDTITLDVDTLDGIGEMGVSGSYLQGSLDDHVKGGSQQGLSLSALGALGVDVIDIGGSKTGAGNVILHIDSADAAAVSAAGLSFATGDTITLDLTAVDDSNVSGSYLAGSLDTAVTSISNGLSLSALGALGVDVIDLDGSTGHVALHIASGDVSAMSSAGLSFAAGDKISLDVSVDDLGGTGVDGSGSGSYLSGTLDNALGHLGLSLSGLGDLGVSVVDIGGSDVSAPLHISSSDAAALANAGLSFASADHIVLDGMDDSQTSLRNSEPSTSAETLASAVGDSLGLHAMGIDQVEVDTGVMVTLHEDAGMVFGADQSLKDLLIALGDSGVTEGDMSNSVDAVSAVKVGADANFAIDDAMVKALMDAGLLSANTSSTIEVDTDSEHMSTSLSQLADIGADKVATSQDKVYVDLGDVSDADALSTLLQNLADGSSTLFVQQTDGAAVQEVGLVLTADQATLATAIEADSTIMAQLSHVGITELLIATGDTQSAGDVTLLGQEYHKVVVG